MTTEAERALQAGAKALAQAQARKEKAAESLGRLLEDEDTAQRAARLLKEMVNRPD